MSNADKLKALKLTIDKIDKDYGKGSVMMMNEKSQEAMEVVSTGSIGLDVALGVGGLPRGRVIEIYGPESSGKTTLTLHIAAECQKQGGTVAFVDAEHALDTSYASCANSSNSGVVQMSLAARCTISLKLRSLSVKRGTGSW